MLVSDFYLYLCNRSTDWPSENFWHSVEDLTNGRYSAAVQLRTALEWARESRGTQNEDAARHLYRFLKAQQRLQEVQDRAREARRARERARNEARVCNSLGAKLREAGLRA